METRKAYLLRILDIRWKLFVYIYDFSTIGHVT